jgi:ribosomal protein S18 acetylase RimI-like enzyme
VAAVTVRPARAEEYPAVGELTAAAYLAGGFVTADSFYVAELKNAAKRAAQAEVLVAEDAGTLLGAVAFVPPGSAFGEITEAEDEAAFRMLAVSPAAQGRGVGRALVDACLYRARALGVARMRLSTQPDMAAAHRLYEKLGFVRTPERDWSPVPGVDLWTYELELAP